MDYLQKSHRDNLLLLYFQIDRTLDPDAIKWLEANNYIERKPDKSWRVTGRGRATVRELRMRV